tara:strand:- start:3366 stop:3581 length:216 start_codon:yes stop_codon:yes gene_type:complete
MDTKDWKKQAEFYKKQLDDLKVNRFNLQTELKKKEQEIQRQINIRKNYYRKMTEFRKELLFLLNKKFEDNE